MRGKGSLTTLYSLQKNPCHRCSACCAAYRVSFYKGEADVRLGGSVPPELTEPFTEWVCCMKGTNREHPYCAALEGTIGLNARCTIYDRRSSTCRGFGVRWKNDAWLADENDIRRCNKARQAWRLPPLHVQKYILPKK